MIPAANITAWREAAPWPTDEQVEQDLILSRLIIEIANHDLLGPELAFRGGTCFHKLYLVEPLRYSEDLDYVRMSRSGIGPYLDALREIVADVGLVVHATESRGSMVHLICDTEPTSGRGRIRIKVEINISETKPCFPLVSRPYSLDSPWWQGSASIKTFVVEELMATKLRALYQRSKGRDLFDLWLALTELDVVDREIAVAFHHYMQADAFSYPQLAQNLHAKLDDPDFNADIGRLVVELSRPYDPTAAAELLLQRVGCHLRNAPA